MKTSGHEAVDAEMDEMMRLTNKCESLRLAMNYWQLRAIYAEKLIPLEELPRHLDFVQKILDQ